MINRLVLQGITIAIGGLVVLLGAQFICCFVAEIKLLYRRFTIVQTSQTA